MPGAAVLLQVALDPPRSCPTPRGPRDPPAPLLLHLVRQTVALHTRGVTDTDELAERLADERRSGVSARPIKIKVCSTGPGGAVRVWRGESTAHRQRPVR
jgi:hypothetical protein